MGDTINGFKVMKIPQSYDDAIVTLIDPSGTIVTLKDGESMRREDEGAWTKSDLPAPAPMVIPDTKADESTTSSSAGAAMRPPPAKVLKFFKETQTKT